MVKVLSTVPHPTVVKEIICKKCGSLLEYTPIDVKEQKWTDYSGDTNTTSYITCPTCDNDVTISVH